MTLQDILLDTKTISSDRLNIEAKTRSNLFSWNGQFSPLLVNVLLENYACSDHLVVDPFMGSGTVIVEAGRRNLRAFGADINPSAFLMAQIYGFINSPLQERKSLLVRIGRLLEESFGAENLCAKTGNSKGEIVMLWQAETAPEARRLIEALIIMSDFYKTPFSGKSILTSWNRLFRIVEELPFSYNPVIMALTDARNLPLQKNFVDLVVTSPPYINVFNYHQQYRASAEALNWNVLHVAKSEIGSNRKNRGNRFLTVIQYCLDIAETLTELRRVCKPSARIIMVVGRESTVRKTRLLNGDIVSRIGVRCVGLTAEKRQERFFTNRYGATIFEDIIHFRVDNSNVEGGESPRTIAEESLYSALKEAPEEAITDIKDALARISQVQPSPIFELLP